MVAGSISLKALALGETAELVDALPRTMEKVSRNGGGM